MERIHTNSIEIELASLDLRYSHTRVANAKAQDQMTRSIERYGQRTPVVVVSHENRQGLIDGYLRVGSLKILGKDTVMAEISQSDERESLVHLLGRTQERQWEAVEQAWIIRELKERFEYPLREIARAIGHDISWVSRRLAMINELPEDILKCVLSGNVSTWAASRVLMPLARANARHAQKLTEHLSENPLSTRELSDFLKHYELSNKQTRERMISDPCLFVKAHKARQSKKSAKRIHQGPEDSWTEDFDIVKSVLRRILRRLPEVIYEGQDEQERKRLLLVFQDALSVITDIQRKIDKVVKA